MTQKEFKCFGLLASSSTEDGIIKFLRNHLFIQEYMYAWLVENKKDKTIKHLYNSTKQCTYIVIAVMKTGKHWEARSLIRIKKRG